MSHRPSAPAACAFLMLAASASASEIIVGFGAGGSPKSASTTT
jgi:hypothetical protein